MSEDICGVGAHQDHAAVNGCYGRRSRGRDGIEFWADGNGGRNLDSLEEAQPWCRKSTEFWKRRGICEGKKYEQAKQKCRNDRITSTHYIEDFLGDESKGPIGTRCARLGSEGAREKVGKDRREDDPQPVW